MTAAQDWFTFPEADDPAVQARRAAATTRTQLAIAKAISASTRRTAAERATAAADVVTLTARLAEMTR